MHLESDADFWICQQQRSPLEYSPSYQARSQSPKTPLFCLYIQAWRIANIHQTKYCHKGHSEGEFANDIRILAQYLVLAETATFVFDFKSLWLIDFFG